MEAIYSSSRQLQTLVENYALRLFLALISLVAVSFFTARFGARSHKASRQPPSLMDPIPYVFNTLQFMLANEKFMERAKNALKSTSIAKFYLGTKPIYLVSGPKNIQAIFGRSQNINNEGLMLERNLPVWYRFSKEDLKRFAADKSGRGKNPIPGTEGIPQDQRYFFGYEHVHSAYMATTQQIEPLVAHYQQQFSETLDRYSDKEWTTLSVRHFSEYEVTRCAVHTLIGPKAFEIAPNFLDLLIDFDHSAGSLAMKLPKWIFPKPYKAHKKYLAAVKGYLDAAWKNFDWNDPSAVEAVWEPHFGALACREIVKWFRDNGFNQPYTGAGAIGIFVWAGTSNVIPIMTWMIMQIARDSALLLALREEVDTAYVTDPVTGARALSIRQVSNLPLLTSAYTEALRLSMSFNVVRDVRETFTLDGYTIEEGAMVQVPTLAAHYDEEIWGAEEHPASEFWAERHIKYVNEKDECGNMTRKRVFAMAGKTGSHYFPYGGGNLICPGRHFAKQEIVMTAALLVTKLDIEFVQWTMFDGKPSDRAAQNEAHFCGTGSAPPDRDMKIRIKRISPL